ncbi:MAG: prepilin peptidase, partial [Candidatus Aenigmatarchaeota archaeon]
MLGWVLLVIGIAGFGLAGYLDLKTTEFPDWIPYFIIVSALVVRGISAWLLQDLSIITESVLIGIVFLAFGLGLYYLKQWGDGDAWLLGAIGFLFPNPSGFQAVTMQFSFPIIMLFNFFF